MNICKQRYPLLAVAWVFSLPLAANQGHGAYSAMPAVDCVINPHRVVDIASPVPGIIESLHVERSQSISAGQVIAQLESSVERANVALARYRATVQSEIGLGKVNMTFDELRKERFDSLYEQQGISRENADQVEREAQLSRWKLKQARELLDIRRLELQRAEEQLRQKSIRAPFSGYVLDTFKHEGEYVEEQAILRLAQLDPLVIEAIVPMENFGLIKPGMLAEIRPEVLVQQKLLGTVTAVDLIGDTASNTFGVKLSMPNPENRIPAGLKCVVKFFDQASEQVALVADNLADKDAGTVERKSAGTVARTGQSATVSAGQLDAVYILGNADTPVTTIDDARGPGIVDETAGAASLATIDVPEMTGKTPTSYMVLIRQADSSEATRELIRRLGQAGIHDLLKFDSGANKGLISLGVYRSRDAAMSRERLLNSLGFDAFTVDRYR